MTVVPLARANALSLCALIALAASPGCVDPATDTHEGIAVGNPGVVSMSLAAATDFSISKAELPVDFVGFAACGGSDRLTTLGVTHDFALAPLSVSFPAGEWCGVVVRFASVARIEATWDDGVESATVAVDLSLAELQLQSVDGALVVDEGTALALEFASPDWLDKDALGLADGAELSVLVKDDLSAELAASVGEESALFEDVDASGEVELPERDRGPVALPAQIAFNEDVAAGLSSDADSTAGCSCTTGSSASWSLSWVVVLGLLGAGRRRRSATGRDSLLT